MASDRDFHFMSLALEQGRRAFLEEEVPVGAVLVCYGQIVGQGRNAKEHSKDPTAHAEIMAIREAANHLGRWRLKDCTLYVTLEPCPMCVGAMLSARIARLVYGCSDPKAGAVGTLFRLGDDPRLNHQIEISGGVLDREARNLLQQFFQARRRKDSRVEQAMMR